MDSLEISQYGRLANTIFQMRGYSYLVTSSIIFEQDFMCTVNSATVGNVVKILGQLASDSDCAGRSYPISLSRFATSGVLIVGLVGSP